jgi:hypothetical protein
MNIRSKLRNSACIFVTIVVMFAAGCVSVPPKAPYPVFVQVDEITEMFMAGLPGIRARQFSGDSLQRNISARIDLPIDWSGSSGGSPGKALEIFVLDGELQLADVLLGGGSYAYLPPGTLGFNMSTSIGASILYFLEPVDSAAVIKTPLIMDSNLLTWQPTDIDGVVTKELRADPGSGTRIWLQRVEPNAKLPWEESSAVREGYLVTGLYRHSECVTGVPVTGEYHTDGYFQRPSGAINGGPEAVALADSIWLFREQRAGSVTVVDACGEPEPE